MTCALDLAVSDAENELYEFDRNVDRIQFVTAVQRLARNGASLGDLGAHFRKSPRTIQRAKCVEVPQIPAHNPHITAERAAELEATAKTATALAFRLRDENPRVTWEALSKLDRQELQELAVVLLAAVPIDQSLTDMFAWVYPLGGDL